MTWCSPILRNKGRTDQERPDEPWESSVDLGMECGNVPDDGKQRRTRVDDEAR